ncbi:MAG: hypothetical protein QUU85_13980, partial [Candidatus Eisenbacteria bacterium]|nr:hypothetical protein [Candidatus Eisenbacteria bacterium]
QRCLVGSEMCIRDSGGAESAGGRSGGNGADPWEQTTRAVRAAAEAYERAIAILQERVPPVEQELQDDGSEEDGAGGEQDGGVAGG